MGYPVRQGVKIGKMFCKILSVFVVDKGMIKWVTPLGRVFKIGKRLCKILSVLVVDKGMIKWGTPLGRVFKIHDFFRRNFVGF